MDGQKNQEAHEEWHGSVTDSGIRVVQCLSISVSGTLDLLFKLRKVFGERSVVDIA